MKPRRIIRICLIIVPLLWSGCSGLNPTIDKSKESENHLHSITQTRSSGDQQYDTLMKYDDREGILTIVFTNTDEGPVRIIREKDVKALLTLPDGEIKEFFFINPVKRNYPNGSWQSKRQLPQKPKSKLISFKEDFLKDLSNFSLKVWVPVKDTTYILKYEYPEPTVFSIPDSIMFQW
jgi:hypothetical protein